MIKGLRITVVHVYGATNKGVRVRTTIGVEEEFVLLDPAMLTPVERAGDALEALRSSARTGTIMAEFFASQLEFATPVCTSSTDILATLEAFRAELHSWSANAGLLAAGVGLPYQVAATARITNDSRYLDIASHFGLIIADHQVNGLHAHVGVADRDGAIAASNRLRPWLPVLLALSANSPYWKGTDTGFDSWRAIHNRRWTTHGIPPHFRDAADYGRRTSALHGIGGSSDAGTLNWVVRPSERYPTVEVRVFDAQLDAGTSAALAAIVRGLVSSPPAELPPAEPELLDSAFWHAARNGLSNDLVDPRSGRLNDAAKVAHTLVDHASAGLSVHDDLESAGAAVERILSNGNGATQQRRAMQRGGTKALAELIRGRLEE